MAASCQLYTVCVERQCGGRAVHDLNDRDRHKHAPHRAAGRVHRCQIDTPALASQAMDIAEGGQVITALDEGSAEHCKHDNPIIFQEAIVVCMWCS